MPDFVFRFRYISTIGEVRALTEENILAEKKDSILIVTLNRPRYMNALNLETLKQGRKILTDIYFDPEVRAVIITGAGDKAFCAGADLKERDNMSEAQVRYYIKTIKDTLMDIENLSKPVICAINGVAESKTETITRHIYLSVLGRDGLFGFELLNDIITISHWAYRAVKTRKALISTT